MSALPWKDCTKWKPGFWYPMPIGAVWIDDPDIWIHEGYDIFYQDAEEPNDIIPALDVCPPLCFRTAVAVCEAHNGERFEELYKEQKVTSEN